MKNFDPKMWNRKKIMYLTRIIDKKDLFWGFFFWDRNWFMLWIRNKQKQTVLIIDREQKKLQKWI